MGQVLLWISVCSKIFAYLNKYKLNTAFIIHFCSISQSSGRTLEKFDFSLLILHDILLFDTYKPKNTSSADERILLFAMKEKLYVIPN